MRVIVMLFAALFLTASSCNEETIVAIDKGTIMGQVHRYTELAQVRPDNSAINVGLKGTDGKQILFETGKDGKFTFKDIEPGVYDIICSFPEDDTAAIYSFQFSGNGTAWVDGCEEKLRVIKPSTAIFKDVTAAIVNDSLRIRGSKEKMVSDLAAYFHYRVFLGAEAGITKESGKYALSIPLSNDATDSLINYEAPASVLKTYFKKGQLVYLIVYPGYSLFFKDDRTGYSYYSGLGQPSEVVSFTMP